VREMIDEMRKGRREDGVSDNSRKKREKESGG
jgi:hypothetical protein